jgi:hypothetical protein
MSKIVIVIEITGIHQPASPVPARNFTPLTSGNVYGEEDHLERARSSLLPQLAGANLRGYSSPPIILTSPVNLFSLQTEVESDRRPIFTADTEDRICVVTYSMATIRPP